MIPLEDWPFLILIKHRMSRIYCSHAKVWEEFIQRGKSKPFGENDNRDDKKIYLS